MNHIKKNEWVRKTKGQIRVYKALIKALEILATSDKVKALDGKRVTKTQIDKLQSLMPEYITIEIRCDGVFNSTVDIWLYADMNGLREPETLFNNCHYAEKIYQYHRDDTMPVYLGTDRIFNFDNFAICVQTRIKNLKTCIAEYELCVKNINRYQKAYAKMENVINETLAKIPYPLKAFLHFTNPILDD